MAAKDFGLEFTFHNGNEKQKWYTEKDRNAEFNRWAKKLNKPGYKDPQVKSVRKIYK